MKPGERYAVNGRMYAVVEGECNDCEAGADCRLLPDCDDNESPCLIFKRVAP